MAKHKKRKLRTQLIRLSIVIILIVGFLFTPFYQVVKSYAVMSVYSKIHDNASFMKKEGIRIKMPGGLSTFKKDYFPFVMTYDTTEEFSRYLDTDVDLVVLYNFGAMEWLKGSSLMYNEDSPYYSGFYGAYVARYNDIERQYGEKENGDIDIEEIMEVTNFDLKVLVMRSIGNKTPHIDYKVVNEDKPYTRTIDGLDFKVYDAELYMDGMNHEYSRDYTAYIQYGKPPKSKEPIESFKKMNGYGRIYVYFDYDTSVSYFFYIIGPTKETIEETEVKFILPSEISGIIR